jgi:hypothetical protein
MEVGAGPLHLGQIAHQQVVALLVADAAHRAQVELGGVHSEVHVQLGLAEDFAGVDVVGDGGDGLGLDAGHPAEAVDDAGGYGHKFVIVAQLPLKEVPEYAVFRLVFPLDLHVVVNPHHPFFGVGVDDARRALVLVAVEIHSHVVPPAAGDVAQQHPGQAEVQHPEEVGRGCEVFDVQVLMGGQVEKALVVK